MKKLEACLRRQTSEEDRKTILDAVDEPVVVPKRKRATKKQKVTEDEIVASQDVRMADTEKKEEEERRPNFEIIEKIEQLKNMEIEDKDEPILKSSSFLNSYPVTPKSNKKDKNTKRKSFLLENNISVLLSPSHTYLRREEPPTAPKVIEPIELDSGIEIQVPQITLSPPPPPKPAVAELLNNVNDVSTLKHILVSLVTKYPHCESFVRSELASLPTKEPIVQVYRSHFNCLIYLDTSNSTCTYENSF